jgi:hypothetical protein
MENEYINSKKEITSDELPDEVINEILNYKNLKNNNDSETSDSESESDAESDAESESGSEDESEGDSESKSESDSDSDQYIYVDSDDEIKKTKYARDEIFGNKIYKDILYEHKFSEILEILEFTKENRGVSQKHVDDIYNHYLKNPKEFIKPLDIICYIRDDAESDHFYIADGQHRFTALKKLYDVNGIDRDLLYFIHDAKNEEEIRKIIKSLNSSNPVNSVYSFEKIPDFIKKIGSKYTNILFISSICNIKLFI